MNQNFTLCLVCFMTLRIMIEAKRYCQHSTPLKTYLVEKTRRDSEDVDVRVTRLWL